MGLWEVVARGAGAGGFAGFGRCIPGSDTRGSWAGIDKVSPSRGKKRFGLVYVRTLT